jgi:tetratricopeptide (TPR) repeat protein
MNFLLLLLWGLCTMALAADIDNHGGTSFLSHGDTGLYSRRGEFKAPLDLFDLEELNRFHFSESKKINSNLKRVKYYLVNGEIKLASVYLSKMAHENTKLRPVIYRYLAVLAFIEGNFKRSYDVLKGPELSSSAHFSKVCLLRIMNQIVLNITHDLEDLWSRCRVEAQGHFVEPNLPWIEALVKIKLAPLKGVTKTPFRAARLESMQNEELKVFLKLAIFLNQEHEMLDQLPLLSSSQLQDQEVRELVGHVFFRSGKLAQAYKYIEDLRSPNAENIKGNLYILRNKYEIAYAQFKLALEQKHNSQNAIERLLPLAWVLGDWEGGAKYAELLLASAKTITNKLTLSAAFKVQKGSFEEAVRILNTITQKSPRGAELDVTQLYSFSALMQNKVPEARRFANASCALMDLTNCWLLYQLYQWDAFPIMVRRDDKITHKSEWEKLTKEDINTPLKEQIYVNQVDIEELDDKLIQLVPN